MACAVMCFTSHAYKPLAVEFDLHSPTQPPPGVDPAQPIAVKMKPQMPYRIGSANANPVPTGVSLGANMVETKTIGTAINPTSV